MKSILKFIAGFFEEEPGVSSSKRLIFILGSLFNMFLCFKLALMGKYTLIELSSFIGIIQAVFSGTYLIGRSQESK